MKLEVAKSTNFKQPRVTSLRRERKKNCFSVRMEGYQFLVHIFMATAVVKIRVLLVFGDFLILDVSQQMF